MNGASTSGASTSGAAANGPAANGASANAAPAASRPRALRALRALTCGAFLLVAAAGLHAQEDPVAAPAGGSGTQTALLDLQTALRRLADAVLPVVVKVETESSAPDDAPAGPEWDPSLLPDPEQDPPLPIPGVGSGVLVRRDAGRYYVLTNNHVVQDKERITVTLNDRRAFPAEVVGTDVHADLAVLAIDANGDLPVAVLGDSDGVRPGDLVLAAGSPFGLDATLTLGVVSAVGRSGVRVRSISDFIQTDATMNPGNSGGALVDVAGRVVGINTWIQTEEYRSTSPRFASTGIGFALPINNAKPVIDQLIETGAVRYAWLGVSVGGPDILEDLAPGRAGGAVIFDVFDGQPAAAAGIRPGDVVLSAGDRPIGDSDALIRAIAALTPEAPAEFRLVRDGAERTVVVRPGVRGDPPDLATTWPNVRVQPLQALTESRRAVRPDAGVYVTMAPEDSELLPGDTIVGIDGAPVAGLRDFYRLINAKPAGVFVVRAVRGGGEVTGRLER